MNLLQLLGKEYLKLFEVGNLINYFFKGIKNNAINVISHPSAVIPIDIAMKTNNVIVLKLYLFKMYSIVLLLFLFSFIFLMIIYKLLI